MTSTRRALLTDAGITAAYLLGGIAVGLAIALPISAIPEEGNPHAARNVASGIALLIAVAVAARLWGRVIAARTGCADPRRFGRIAMWTFAPVLMCVAVVLGLLEPVFVGAGARRGLAIHVVYLMLFPTGTFLVAGITAGAMTTSLGSVGAAMRSALATGAAAALAFLAAALVMDAIGWRVGAPHAAERATMLVVTLIGCLCAALAGGAMLGRRLRRTGTPADPLGLRAS